MIDNIATQVEALTPGLKTIRIRVAVETPQHAGLAGALDYGSAARLAAGTLVRVPLGRREVPGIVWDGGAGAEDPAGPAAADLRLVGEALDSLPPLDARWRALVAFTAAYYQRALGEVALSVLPPELRKLGSAQLAKRIAGLMKALGSRAAERPGLEHAQAPAPVLRTARAGATVASEAPVTASVPGGGKTGATVPGAAQVDAAQAGAAEAGAAHADAAHAGAAQAGAAQADAAQADAAQADAAHAGAAHAGAAHADAAHADAAQDDAEQADAAQDDAEQADAARLGAAPAEAPVLGAAQAEALARIAGLASAVPGATALLHGVTGSGKTEVYLGAAAATLAAGRQALVLVPEINLTPQLEARFAARFKGRHIVSMHSGLTPAQRLRGWLAAHLGLADLVLGTRLAVFASMPRLGLIVVDEEHDPSYKQQDGARYSARDLAIYRGRLEGATVVLGSATPSLETWQRAIDGRYTLLSLPERVGGGTLPTVRTVDMNLLPKARGHAVALSSPLVAALQQRIDAGEQSLVFLNRRGYAPVLHCGDCGWKSGCPHCSAWRVFHKLDRSLRCHHCGFAERVPRACPDCGNLDIAPIGRGTERLEEQLAGLLTGRDGAPVRIARIDADSTRSKGALEAQLGAVHAGEVDVLVGTQMITKGHDFRRITLVAAVDPDGALFSSDFRAPERLFALLMQAGGRAGRDAAQAARSEMWVQTWHPRHPLFGALRRHDFAAFAASQLAERESAGLPPYSHLAMLRADARTPEAARAFLDAAEAVAATLPGADDVTRYPPVPLTIARVANVERMQMLVESASRPRLQRYLADWLPALLAVRRDAAGAERILRWAIDVDPLSI